MTDKILQISKIIPVRIWVAKDRYEKFDKEEKMYYDMFESHGCEIVKWKWIDPERTVREDRFVLI